MKQNPSLTQIITLIPKLTAKERTTVAIALKEFQARDAKEQTGEQDWILEGIYTILRQRGILAGRLPLRQIKSIAPHYEEDSALVRAHLARRLEGCTHPAQQAAVGRLVAEALADYLGPVMPLGPKALMANVSKIPEALDASYPGYLGAGLLHMILPHGKEAST